MGWHLLISGAGCDWMGLSRCDMRIIKNKHGTSYHNFDHSPKGFFAKTYAVSTGYPVVFWAGIGNVRVREGMLEER